MAIITQTPVVKRIIDLSGPYGNAYVLLGHAMFLSKTFNLDTDEILAEMQEKDYDHLINTFDKYFGHIVDHHIPEKDDE